MPLRRPRRSSVRAVTALVPPAPKRAKHHERAAYLQFHRGEISHAEFVDRIGGI